MPIRYLVGRDAGEACYNYRWGHLQFVRFVDAESYLFEWHPTWRIWSCSTDHSPLPNRIYLEK